MDLKLLHIYKWGNVGNKRCLILMDKGSKLLLRLYKIWVCSPQSAYIYYTHFILYKTSIKAA